MLLDRSDVGWFGSPGLQLCVIEGNTFSCAGISEFVDLLCSEFSFYAVSFPFLHIMELRETVAFVSFACEIGLL